jgi:hypothetical protein
MTSTVARCLRLAWSNEIVHDPLHRCPKKLCRAGTSVRYFGGAAVEAGSVFRMLLLEGRLAFGPSARRRSAENNVYN